MSQNTSPVSRFLKSARKALSSQDFDPGLLGLVVNYSYHSRRALLGFVRSAADEVNGVVLDVGCGSKPYQDLFNHSGYFGIDIENPGHSHEDEEIDIYYDGSALPFADESIDSVVCFEVMEHVQNLPAFMAEIHRVLKPGGRYLATMPFLCGEHEQPNDYRRFTRFGIVGFLEENGFTVSRNEQLVQGWPAITSQINIMFALWWRGQTNMPLKALMWLIGRVPVTIMNVLGLILGLWRSNGDMYLHNAIVAQKPLDRTT
ncbi:MAG: class I SAM-dependent methyltransferase [Alphaproteobacteria bacterium]